MQLPIHLIAGIMVQLGINALVPPDNILNPILIIILAFGSHFILDPIAKVTYHPSERIDDNFWLYWHMFVFVAGFLIMAVFIWKYFLGMFFANLVDIWDWLFLRETAKRKGDLNWGKKYYLHQIADIIRAKFFSWLPSLNYNRYGILPELVFILVWAIFVVLFPNVFF
ncbi:MAG: hypothetical protein ACTSPV_03585 [Candidatus Hodarchaeales archaeon]